MSARRTSHYRAKPGATPKENFLGRLLDPIDLLSEAIFSILIVLTFTLAFRILKLDDNLSPMASADFNNDLIIAALGATVAWGLIDGIMYALMSVFERSERHRLLQQIQSAPTQEEGVAVIADELDFILEPITNEDQRQMLYLDMLEHLYDGRPQPVGLQSEDIAGALGSVLVAVLAVLPSLIPFVLLPNQPDLSIRLSNIVSFLVLFAIGYSWGKHAGTNPWRTGLALAAIALAMVLIAIPLGG
ncbi:MAG: hypothetical protein IPM39_00575 [Chloroflexi bacterium]|nr:hypothetical protein [Chloroflexota bacterium]